MVKVERVEAFGWKNCFRLLGSGVEVIVTTDVGPRILGYSLNGKANHMAEHKAELGTSGSDKFVPYGGHRVWHAPELEGRTNVADNDACHYELLENGIIVCCDPDKSGIARGMEITIDEDGVVTIENILRNTTLWDIEVSIWGITQFAMGGVMAVPTSKLNTGLVANRAVSLWPYSKMNDARVNWGDSYITVLPDTKAATPFKFGITDDEQYAAYFNHNQLVVKEFAYYYEADYPNYYCNFESYTNKDFIEIESLSPLLTLEAGDESRHTEKWYIYDNVACPEFKDEEKIMRLIKTNFEKRD